MKNQDFNYVSKFIREEGEKLTIEEIEDTIKVYLVSYEYKLLCTYGDYYESKNVELAKRYVDRANRNKTPNNFVPTAYYSTIVDSMAGYMFQNVQYNSDNEEYTEALKEILEENNIEIKDMITGVRALAFNKAIELVYVTGGEKTIDEAGTENIGETNIKFSTIDPRKVIMIYNNEIEAKPICGIIINQSYKKDYDYFIDVIYADEWQYYNMKDGKLSKREKTRPLFFSQCPVIEYNTEILNNNSSFHVVIPYIDALDYIITGNTNDIEKLTDAILVISKRVQDEDKKHMDEWKLLDDFGKDAFAEYLVKNQSPEFREYMSKWLIQEIHKASHVVDWFSPDTGLSGAVSGKALKTRLFDMDMYSKRIEKIFREGAEKRIALITELMGITSQPTDKVKIIYNRTLPNDIEDKAQQLANVPFISTQTKCEICGIDWEREQERLADEKQENMDRMAESVNKMYGQKVQGTTELKSEEKPEEEIK